MKKIIFTVCALVIFSSPSVKAKSSSYITTCHNVEMGHNEYLNITITNDTAGTGKYYASVVQGNGDERFQRFWLVGKNDFKTTPSDRASVILFGQYGAGPSTFYLEIDATKQNAEQRFPGRVRLVVNSVTFEEEVECHLYN